jgi:hypothetical protein
VELQVLVLVDGFSSFSEIAERVPGASREEITDREVVVMSRLF